ncbi:uncharacterized protein EV154DRAFT_523749 [Mucor mucedo]|uniref:uncharacterized protein n=1 Tax=Mucor mucedo TaxID=29922 RepID=UPI002220897B|nr:uncharacterized protein EV154DRAFT_523749 [Mucor mucedo]KAI7880793.1 hypothetical protein EV154DRAFT_523749 [Mucor mucedo]
MTLPAPLTSPNQQGKNLPRNPSFCSLPEKKGQVRKNVWLTLWNSVRKDLDGRDKCMKILQYVIKLLLYHRVASPKKWSALATQLSITRQVLCLGNVLSDISVLNTTVKKRESYKTALLLIDICNAISDDVYCLYRIGILSKKWGLYSEIISAHCWFISILNQVQTYYFNLCLLEGKGAHPQDLLLAKVNVAKAIADLIFCGNVPSFFCQEI